MFFGGSAWQNHHKVTLAPFLSLHQGRFFIYKQSLISSLFTPLLPLLRPSLPSLLPPIPPQFLPSFRSNPSQAKLLRLQVLGQEASYSRCKILQPSCLVIKLFKFHPILRLCPSNITLKFGSQWPSRFCSKNFTIHVGPDTLSGSCLPCWFMSQHLVIFVSNLQHVMAHYS